jgi:hypothetical protein
MMAEIGFVEIQIGERVDTFGGAAGEANARQFDVYGYPFLARKPGEQRTARVPTTSSGPRLPR